MSDNITTADEHVVLPHQVNWMQRPQITNLWRSGVDAALSGEEDRATVRSEAWKKLEYELLPFNQIERGRMDDRIRAALKAGKLAVPLWGRGVPISEEATSGHSSLSLVRSNHGFTAGKFAIIQSQVPAEFDVWDLCLVDSVSGARLNLAGSISHNYSVGTYVWPLLFGKPLIDDFQVVNSGRSRVKIAVQFDGRQINASAFEDFTDYELGNVSVLNGGEGWAGPWMFQEAA